MRLPAVCPALIGVGLVCCLAGSVRAQAPSDSARTLPLVEVTAARGQSIAALAGARVVRLTREELVAVRAATLADALERRGGAFVRRYGPGGLASVSLRGSGAGQTALVLDGLRLTDPQLGQVDLSLLPAALLGGVDVVHGAASAWHGADALGGLVLLAPRRPHGLDLYAEVGGADAGRVDVAAGHARGRLSLGVTASAEATTGRFGYLDATQFPARREQREGADRQTAAVLASAARRHRTGQTTIGLWGATAARGLPGPAGSRPGGERQDDALARAWVTHQQAVRGGALRVAGYAQSGQIRYRHPGLALDETSRTRGLGAEVEGRFAPHRRVQVGAGASAGLATARHPSLAAVRPDVVVAGFGHAAVRTGALTTVAALRADHYARTARRYTPFSPHLGLHLALGAGWAAKAGTGRSFRAPTLNDRFWRGAGRADLHPEQGWSLDGGLAWTRAAFVAEVTAFQHALRDEIVWQPEGGVWRPENIRRTRARGLEASVRGTRGRVSGGAFATLLRAEDRSAPGSATFGRQLRYVPRATARADAAVRLAPRPLDALRLDAAVEAVGVRPVTADEQQSLAPYALVRVGLAATRGRFTLDVRLENLFNTPYRVLEGYPMPGRQAFAGLRYTR